MKKRGGLRGGRPFAAATGGTCPYWPAGVGQTARARRQTNLNPAWKRQFRRLWRRRVSASGQARRRILIRPGGGLMTTASERQGIVDDGPERRHRHRLEQLFAEIEAEWTSRPGKTVQPVPSPMGLARHHRARPGAAGPAPVVPDPTHSRPRQSIPLRNGANRGAPPIEPAWTDPASVSPHRVSGPAPTVAPSAGAYTRHRRKRPAARPFSTIASTDASDHVGSAGCG